nr:utrophin-like [Lytechinus pictus]
MLPHKRERGLMRVHQLNNVNRALQVLHQNKVRLVNISSNDIVDGNPKLTLGLVWSIIAHWEAKAVLKDTDSSMEQQYERTVLTWCKETTQGYERVDVKNFTSSWRDGLAFNAILHRYRSVSSSRSRLFEIIFYPKSL